MGRTHSLKFNNVRWETHNLYGYSLYTYLEINLHSVHSRILHHRRDSSAGKYSAGGDGKFHHNENGTDPGRIGRKKIRVSRRRMANLPYFFSDDRSREREICLEKQGGFPRI